MAGKAKAGNKTVETAANVDAFIETIADPGQRADARTLVTLMAKASGAPPRLWGPSIIGFGSYHYRYDSGREGSSLRIGFSPRKGKTALYFPTGFELMPELLARLGKHDKAKACLYVKRLSDVDLQALAELCAASLADLALRYP